MSLTDERKVDPIKEMTRIAQTSLSIVAHGFRESYQSAEPARLIYDSEFCRLKLFWDGWDHLNGNMIGIRYGRLHAPSDKVLLTWNGEECHCWHDVNHALHFLDSRTPAEAVKLIYSHPVIAPFFTEEIRHRIIHQADWLAEMHATIWKHYGERFFELFDLRQPNLWEQYRQFLKEFYDIKGRSRIIKPSLDKVC